MASSQSAVQQTQEPHIHLVGECCPVCDQQIPNEKVEEVRARMEARESALTEAADARAANQLALDKKQIEANARVAVEQVKEESAKALTKLTSEIAGKEVAAREAGKKEAQAALQAKLTAAEEAKTKSEAAAQLRIAEMEQAGKQRDADWQEKVAAAERAKQAAANENKALKAGQDQLVNERVQEMREILDRNKADELNAQNAKHFEEKQKLKTMAQDLQRRLDKKTAEELGEGAEVDLFESLKSEFEGDRIERVRKGVSGADIIHTVIHNCRECGKIIYDSKNSTAWRSDYVSKLVEDQTAAKADHAVLSTFKFPGEAKQVEVRDGVIIVNPARAIALAQIIRKHVVHVHTLRLSKTGRTQKMAALYELVTSDRCRHLLERIESHADSLLEMQVKEIKAHNAHWKKQGLHMRSIQKVKAELENDIDQVISTDDGAELAR